MNTKALAVVVCSAIAVLGGFPCPSFAQGTCIWRDPGTMRDPARITNTSSVALCSLVRQKHGNMIERPPNGSFRFGLAVLGPRSIILTAIRDRAAARMTLAAKLY
jgi:hypothetical protein